MKLTQLALDLSSLSQSLLKNDNSEVYVSTRIDGIVPLIGVKLLKRPDGPSQRRDVVLICDRMGEEP